MILSFRSRFLPALAGLALLPCASAQQFVHQVGMVPGPSQWTEGVECADVDHDGDLDIFFAAGQNSATAGSKKQNMLLINNFVPSGTLSFTDASVARLGVHTSIAKMVITCDVDGDGWVDVLFCNALDLDPPSLYMNQGAANPGFFTLESATRGFTSAFSCGSGQFGDLDDDGDPDLILNDGYFVAARRPHLYFNDGAGHFTESPASIAAAALKSDQMDTQLVDLDGDWDLDFFGACRASNGGVNHYLMLNNGAGTFTNAPVNVPSNSGLTYEGEVGDLDGDNDIDLFLVSSTSFSEGAIRNELAPSGTLGLTKLGALAGDDDDNEIALCDYDCDGDYDPIVGSLSGPSEVFWRNNGGMSFTNVSVTTITQLTDSTLDCTFADLDDDGRYDLVTAQGESGTFINRIYKNNGPVDTRAPVVTAVQSPATFPPLGPFKVHAKARDQVMDDGVDYLSASARYVVLAAPSTGSVDIQPGGFVPAVLNVTPGTRVDWTNNSGANASVTSTTSPFAYDSGSLAPSAGYSHYFVHPGTYDYTSSNGGFSGQVIVSGADSTVAATAMGGGERRFLMTDTAAGTGVQLVYELVFTDWPGNVSVTDPAMVPLVDPCGPVAYCTAKVNSLGCTPAIGSSGHPSASLGSGFTITATNVLNNKAGVLFYGVHGRLAQPFQGGTLCVKAPTRRTPLQVSGGSSTGNDCTGTFAFDFNARIASGVDALLVQGATVDAQYWSRDQSSPSGTNLTNAIEFPICP